MPDPQRILLVGDLHMNTLAAFQVIDHAQSLGADLILQVGDFGFWPRGASNSGQKYLRKVDAQLAKAGLELWFVPGNHEDWTALARRPIGEDGVRVISAQIREIPIGHRWTWGTTRWLAVGGRILGGVQAARWFHGHHHVRYTSTIPTAHGEVRVEGLALDGTPLDELALLVDADGYPILEPSD